MSQLSQLNPYQTELISRLRTNPRGEASPIVPNRAASTLAEALRSVKGSVPLPDVYIPGLGRTSLPPLGELLTGDADEAVDDLAHGFLPTRGRGLATTLNPSVADLAAVGGEAGALVNALRRGATQVGKSAMDALPSPEFSQSRRDFAKKAGAVGAVGVAAPAALVSMLRSGAKTALKPEVAARAYLSEMLKYPRHAAAVATGKAPAAYFRAVTDKVAALHKKFPGQVKEEGLGKRMAGRQIEEFPPYQKKIRRDAPSLWDNSPGDKKLNEWAEHYVATGKIHPEIKKFDPTNNDMEALVQGHYAHRDLYDASKWRDMAFAEASEVINSPWTPDTYKLSNADHKELLDNLQHQTPLSDKWAPPSPEKKAEKVREMMAEEVRRMRRD